MFHDFDDHHGGKGNECDNGNHIMSYGDWIGQTKFSSCSKKDWQAHYLYIKKRGFVPGSDTNYGSECVTKKCSKCFSPYSGLEFSCRDLQNCNACFNYQWCMEGNNVV